MEKALHGAHGVSYAVYSQKHDVRMRIERKRQEEYARCKQMVASLEKKLHF